MILPQSRQRSDKKNSDLIFFFLPNFFWDHDLHLRSNISDFGLYLFLHRIVSKLLILYLFDESSN